jgi:hypothetical protein
MVRWHEVAFTCGTSAIGKRHHVQQLLRGSRQTGLVLTAGWGSLPRVCVPAPRRRVQANVPRAELRSPGPLSCRTVPVKRIGERFTACTPGTPGDTRRVCACRCGRACDGWVAPVAQLGLKIGPLHSIEAADYDTRDELGFYVELLEFRSFGRHVPLGEGLISAIGGLQRRLRRWRTVGNPR